MKNDLRSGASLSRLSPVHTYNPQEEVALYSSRTWLIWLHLVALCLLGNLQHTVKNAHSQTKSGNRRQVLWSHGG